MEIYNIIMIFAIFTCCVSHSIISTDYVEECDNSICEYTNKIVLLIHPYYYNNITIGYDNITSSDIYFDLHSAYYLYDVDAADHRLYDFRYEYDYNCMNEIFNIPYEFQCNSTLIGSCNYYQNVIPFSTSDCLGLQRRYVEYSTFIENGGSTICVTKKNVVPRLAGTITVGNNSVIFDVELEIGRLSTISSNSKITLLSNIDKRGLSTVCKQYTDRSGIVLDLIKGQDINDFISRRIINGHLITNFQESLLSYDLDRDLVINQKGIFKIDNSTYYFLYYKTQTLNETIVCKPIPYSDGYGYTSGNTIELSGESIEFYLDKNCTKQPEGTISPSFTCSNGFIDMEDNVFCSIDGMLKLMSGKVVSQEIQDDFMIQISYKGNYKTKQVFYDRCRIRSMEYINGTIYLYDCSDDVYIKNKYTNRVYKVRNGMNITLPDGLYLLADYVSSPMLYVTNSVPTVSMYYAKDKFYTKTMLTFGFSINTIEKKSSYIIYYIVFTVLLVVILYILVITFRKLHNKLKNKGNQDNSLPDIEEKQPLIPKTNYNYKSGGIMPMQRRF